MTADERAVCERCATGAGGLTDGVYAAARHHRLHLVLASTVSAEERQSPLGRRLGRELTLAAGLLAWEDEATRDLLDALGSAGIPAVVLKGAGLAHTVYAQPHLRPRADVDLLIDRDALAGTERVLAARGWTRPPEPERTLSAAQRHYTRQGHGAVRYHADVHWKIANPRAFADLLTFDELLSRAVPIPALGQFGRTLSLVDALLLACIHRVAHHDDAIDLLWLWDIHLLVARLTPDGAADLRARAAAIGTAAVCARGIRLAGALFGAPAATGLAAVLDNRRGAASVEPSAAFLGGPSAVAALGHDLRALGWRDRLRLVAEHLFPPAIYMRGRYPGWPDALLPLAYVHRIVRGAPKWFRRGGDRS